MITAEEIRNAAQSYGRFAVDVRRHLHSHPELSFAEKETGAYIASRLEELAIPYTAGVGGNGLVATVHGDGDSTNAPSADSGANGDRVVALRADMDALPINEENDVPYASSNEGVMHACGHDAHMTCLLTAGRILNDLRSRFTGIVKLLFQPAEERAPGGALELIRAGVLESPRVDVVIGQHVNPEIPVGSVGFRSGLFMASADEIYITIHGRGGHAAKPHQNVDPVTIASELIVVLQQIVSRNADPVVPSVLSFGHIHGGGSPNVIPDTVELSGTFRTVDARWREDAIERIETTTKAIVSALGADAEVRTLRGYPPVVNDESVTNSARRRAAAYLGEDSVVELPPAMWAEDFSYYLGERPGCFYNLGVGNEDSGIVHPVHTARFAIDESALAVGAGVMAWIALGEFDA